MELLSSILMKNLIKSISFDIFLLNKCVQANILAEKEELAPINWNS